MIFDPHSLGGTDDDEGLPLGRPATREHGWIGPFVMASYNTRIVRRSSELLGYGPDFAYREVSAYSNPVVRGRLHRRASARSPAASRFPPTRFVLDRVLPGPGDGPSEKARANGYFKVEVHGGGHVATVAAKGDPGYAATAVMMGESALSLAAHRRTWRRAHPASAMGERARRAAARRRHDATVNDA